VKRTGIQHLFVRLQSEMERIQFWPEWAGWGPLLPHVQELSLAEAQIPNEILCGEGKEKGGGRLCGRVDSFNNIQHSKQHQGIQINSKYY